MASKPLMSHNYRNSCEEFSNPLNFKEGTESRATAGRYEDDHNARINLKNQMRLSIDRNIAKSKRFEFKKFLHH